MSEETITVTVLKKDALCLVLGPLEYTVQVMNGNAEKGASPMRIRQIMKQELDD